MPTATAFLASTQHDAARRFYTAVLGFRLVDEHGFAMVFDAFGTTLRLQKVEAVVLAPYTAFGLEFESIAALEAKIDALAAHGISGERYPHFAQDERAIWTAPGGARVFWFKDPDGNLLSLSHAPV